MSRKMAQFIHGLKPVVFLRLSDKPEAVPDCLSCGLCCRTLTVPVDKRKGDKHIPDDLIERNIRSITGLSMKKVDDQLGSHCIALDPKTNICSIYENRPQACRAFTRGSWMCDSLSNRKVTRLKITALEALLASLIGLALVWAWNDVVSTTIGALLTFGGIVITTYFWSLSRKL